MTPERISSLRDAFEKVSDTQKCPGCGRKMKTKMYDGGDYVTLLCTCYLLHGKLSIPYHIYWLEGLDHDAGAD